MELVIVLPLVMVMGAMAVFLSLSDRPAPATARASMANGSPMQPRLAYAAQRSSSRSRSSSSVLSTDALLAEALTEMVSIKEELAGLRSKVDVLTTEVEALRAAKTASRRPSRKAA